LIVEASKDGYVLAGLSVNKCGDRSSGVGKHFGRLKSGLGHGSRIWPTANETIKFEDACDSYRLVTDLHGSLKAILNSDAKFARN